MIATTSIGPNNEIINLTNVTFRDFLEQNEAVLVGFFLPFLPVFQRFARVYQEVAQQLSSSGVQFAQVNCETETEIYQDFKFSRWPTVRLFRGFGHSKEYEGAWQTLDIVSWVMRQILPSISVITSTSFQDLRCKSNVVIVGYFAPEDLNSRETFTSIADTMQEDYIFGLIDDDSLAKSEHLNMPSIAVYKSFDEAKSLLKLPCDKHAIISFVKTSGTPSVIEFHPELRFSYAEAGLPLGYILTETAEQRTQLRKTVLPLAKKYKDRIIFGTVDAEVSRPMLEDLHLVPNKWPAFVIKDNAKGQHFPMDPGHELSEYVLDSFVQDFLDSKLKPVRVSEPIPETQNGPVTVVVGDTYEEIVLNSEKDVLLDYYTQSCGPCKAMYPMYEKLASLYASDSTSSNKVTIAKVDWEANEIPGDIRGFPTFILFPADSKDAPISYKGPWTVTDFATFIRDNGTHKVEVLLE